LSKIVGSAILTVLWVLCFIYIRPTLVIDFGAGIIMSFKFFVILVGLLIIILYHIFYRASPEATKLSLTVFLTIAWIALIFFYPFQPLQGNEAEAAAGVEYDGAVGFFALIGGLAVCVLWVRFFSDEISLRDE
jgi:predicted membrane channel-forming protein YqfA (hemolysin III family)